MEVPKPSRSTPSRLGKSHHLRPSSSTPSSSKLEGDRIPLLQNNPQEGPQAFDVIRHPSPETKNPTSNLEKTEPVTLIDYVNRVTENTRYLNEQENKQEYLPLHKKAIEELQQGYITGSTLRRLFGWEPSIGEFKKMWDKIKDRKAPLDRTVADVDHGIEASYKLVQNIFRERPNLPQDLHTEYQTAYQDALNFRMQEMKHAKYHPEVVTAVNKYIDLSTKIKEAEDKVLAELYQTQPNQAENSLRKEVKDHKDTYYLTARQNMQLNDKTNIVIIKEMRIDIYERKQWVDTIKDRIRTRKQWLDNTDIPKDLQEECNDAYQKASEEEKKLTGLIDRAKHYDDWKQCMDQPKDLFKAIDGLEQAQFKVLQHTDNKWAQKVKQKENEISDLINIKLSQKIEQLQNIVDEGQRKDDDAFNHSFTVARGKLQGLRLNSEKNLRLAYTAEKKDFEEFDMLLPRPASDNALSKLIEELQQLDTDLDKLLEPKQ